MYKNAAEIMNMEQVDLNFKLRTREMTEDKRDVIIMSFN